MSMPTFDRITTLLNSFLDVQSRRSEIVAGNLANADTPGYAAKELDFAGFLRSAAREALAPQQNAAGQQTAFADSPRVIEQRAPGVTRLDGNTVDAGREMSTMAEAGMQFLAGTQLLQSRLRTLRAAIREGR